MPTSARPTSARSSARPGLPEGSYGRRNRQAIAARETRIAARLRAVEQAYRMAIEHEAAQAIGPHIRTARSDRRRKGSSHRTARPGGRA